MDFKELEYFSTIVKCGNLTHAARQLYVSQPTLSKFLQKLEEDLGLVLFQRGSRRLKLTYAGQRYYAHVERILSQKREMDAEMTDILRSDRGVLYVGIPPFRCSFSLPKVLPIFHKEFPQVQFRIVEAPSAVLDQKLLNGEIDLAFYMSFERITGLSYQVMHRDKMYAQQLYEKKLLTYPRTDSQYLTEDMGQTVQHLVSDLLGLLPFAQGLDLTPEVGRILNSKKVSDHHAIIPTSEFLKQGFTGLAESECKLMNLVFSKLLCAIAAPHEYETVTVVFSCAGNEFTAKGKTVLVPGWKEIDQRFRSTLKADTEEEMLNTLPELAEGQSFRVTSTVSEHFTSPPKAYTEDTLLSAMERAGAEDMPEDAERKGLGTPATRAAILEKLVQMGFVQRKGKQLVPTKDGINLAVVLPESLTSPVLTAEWENRLTEIAKGNADADEFMAEIEAQVRQLVKTYSCISADKQNLFQSERVIIGKCPRCGENVYEGKKNFYCGNRGCQFVMWKNDRFFEQRKKAFTPKIAAALLKNGKAKVKGLYSEKTGKTYDATVLLADTGGKYVNYRVERKE